jgi:multidrug efflux pump subunit AcrA (membrane-fusion protein)
VSLDPIHFVFDASEADFLRYTRLAAAGARPSSRDVQNPVSVRLADESDYKHQGRMDFVDNVLNPKTGTIRGRAVFDNKDGLLTPGSFGRLRLFGGEHDALLVPDGAIASDQASKIVFTVADDGTSAPSGSSSDPLWRVYASFARALNPPIALSSRVFSAPVRARRSRPRTAKSKPSLHKAAPDGQCEQP